VWTITIFWFIRSICICRNGFARPCTFSHRRLCNTLVGEAVFTGALSPAVSRFNVGVGEEPAAAQALALPGGLAYTAKLPNGSALRAEPHSGAASRVVPPPVDSSSLILREGSRPHAPGSLRGTQHRQQRASPSSQTALVSAGTLRATLSKQDAAVSLHAPKASSSTAESARESRSRRLLRQGLHGHMGRFPSAGLLQASRPRSTSAARPRQLQSLRHGASLHRRRSRGKG
jgi:hypothetical protein